MRRQLAYGGGSFFSSSSSGGGLVAGEEVAVTLGRGLSEGGEVPIEPVAMGVGGAVLGVDLLRD